MANLPSIFGSQPLSIQTTDGQQISLQPGQSVIDLIPQGGGGSGPLGRIAVGQPRDTRNPRASNQFFTIKRVKDENTNQWVNEYSDGLGTELTVYPLAVHAVRSYMPGYDPNATGDALKPLCASENFLRPDAKYNERFSSACCVLNPQTGHLVSFCPMAQWGTKDPATGKSKPPACSETYIIFAALASPDGQGEPEVVELYFRSASATNGKTLIQKLRTLVQQGMPIYTFPIQLRIREVGQGNTFAGELVNAAQTYDDDAVAVMDILKTRAEDAIQYRLSRANQLPGQDESADQPSAADMMGGSAAPVPPSAPANKQTVQAPPSAKNNNGAKKALI